MTAYRITYTYESGDVWTTTIHGTKRQALSHIMRSKRSAARSNRPIASHTIEEVV